MHETVIASGAEAIQAAAWSRRLDCFVAREQVPRAPHAEATSGGCGDLFTLAMTILNGHAIKEGRP